MTKSSVKKMSILGLVLIAASAVTAAIIPAKKDKSKALDQRGLYGASTSGANSHTCVPGAGNNCNVTAASGTSGVGEGTASNTTTAND